MDFAVHITMDKEEMRHPRNIARALERLAHELDNRFGVNDEAAERLEGTIRDVTSAVVGRWELSP